MKYISRCQTPIGELTIVEENSKITNIIFENSEKNFDKKNCIQKETPLLQKTCSQLAEYFAKKRTCFSIPLAPNGTEFLQKVWRTLGTIPYGETKSYKEIAEQINHPKAYRAVGLANNKNPIPIIIPCHRVISSNGALTGYAGGLDIKSFLLELEQQI